MIYHNFGDHAVAINTFQYGNDARFIRRSCIPNCFVSSSSSLYFRLKSKCSYYHQLFSLARPLYSVQQIAYHNPHNTGTDARRWADHSLRLRLSVVSLYCQMRLCPFTVPRSKVVSEARTPQSDALPGLWKVHRISSKCVSCRQGPYSCSLSAGIPLHCVVP